MSTTAQRIAFSQKSNHEDLGLCLITVARDGTVQCLDGETLKEQWRTQPDVLFQELQIAKQSECEVEFVQVASAMDAIDGIFEGKHDLFGVYSRAIVREEFNPDVLLVITKVSKPSSNGPQRYLHVLGIMNGAVGQQPQGLAQILVTPIAIPNSTSEGTMKYRIDARSGVVLALCEGMLSSYIAKGSIARLQSTIEVPGVTSFLRLSKTSILAATSHSLEIYNPAYRSLQSKTPLSIESDAQGSPLDSQDEVVAGKMDACELLIYFSTLEIAVGLRGSTLVAVQLEPPRAREAKRRADGLLIDSIGRGLPREIATAKRNCTETQSSVFTDYLPGSVLGNYWTQWHTEVAMADDLLRSQDLEGFENMMAAKLGFDLGTVKQSVNNNALIPEGDVDKEVSEIVSPAELPLADFPQVDRRWVLLAISKVFTWKKMSEHATGVHLTCDMPQSKLLNYLVEAGHLSSSNMKAAFRDDALDEEDIESILAEEVPAVLVEIDPSMELLADYLAVTTLGAIELLTSIRLVTGSLGLGQSAAAKASQLLLTNGEIDDQDMDADAIGMELDKAEEELQVTEFYFLGDQSSSRSTALSLAFSKLESCPAMATVHGIRRLYKPEETLSLINILRTELIRDGWTTRYLDSSQDDAELDIEGGPDGSIRIIADLLCRCIDSVGPSGWLANDALLANFGGQHETADFFEQLKMEVSAALEGIEEAIRLRGILTQAVKFGASLQNDPLSGGAQEGSGGGKKGKAAPAILPASAALQSRMLPFGLKKQTSKVTHQKVVAGGEILARSQREIGHLISQNVGSYSLERIKI
jgi:hypothetical protein